MGKLAERPRKAKLAQQRAKHLTGERRKLVARMAKIDAELARVRSSGVHSSRSNGRTTRASELDKWFDELSQGLAEIPALPADFSRADLYEDHD
jgi:hypothetical protein